jgi:hypothetical protein
MICLRGRSTQTSAGLVRQEYQTAFSHLFHQPNPSQFPHVQARGRSGLQKERRSDAAWLGKNLVNAEDQIAHWKAQGEMTTRDILARMQELGGDDDKRRSFLSLMKEIQTLHPSVYRSRFLRI